MVITLPPPPPPPPSSQGKYILAPGKMTYSEEKLLQFFGQLLGVAMRADVPIALDLLPCFWKSLKREPLQLSDLREADCLTFSLTGRLLECLSAEEFEEVLAGIQHGRGEDEEGGVASPPGDVQFVYTGLDGVEVELCEHGRETAVK